MNVLEARRRLLGRNVYKKTVEDNPAIAQGSLARRYPGITMQGWTQQESTEGKNLFDASKITNENVEVSENNLILKSYACAFGSADLWMKPSTQYTISAIRESTSTASSGGGSLLHSTGEKDPIAIMPAGTGAGTYTFTTPSDLTDYNIYMYGFNDGNEYVISNFMLNEGSTALPYEPYTGGKPSPSPDYPQEIVSAGNYNEETQKWEYEIEVAGGNLFDIQKYIDQNSEFYELGENGGIIQTAADGRPLASLPIQHTLPPGTYVVIGNNYNIQIVSNGTQIVSGFSKFTLEKETDLSYKIYKGGATVYPSAEYFPMISKILDTTYEPYRTPQTVLLTSNRPLTKWDKLGKRNGQWGWVYKSNVHIVNGEENFSIGSNTYVGESTSGVYFVPGDADGRHNIPNEFCNRLSHVIGIWTEDGEIGFCINGDQIHMRLSNEVIGVTSDTPNGEVISAFRNYHIQQYEDGNPFILWYETSDTTFVPLSESEQESINALYTFRPTTVLSNDCGCNMSLMYKTKKSLEVTT